VNLLSVPEAAAFLREKDTPANRALVSRLIADGHLEARRIGRRWFVTRSCLDAYLAPRGEAAPSPRFARGRVGRGA
jgi:excisionase family DNA binding protein